MDEETLFPFDEGEQLRRDEAAFFVLRGREELRQAEPYPTREPCRRCHSMEARLIRRGGHNQVFCADCGYWIYNAPKTETGEKPRTVETVRKHLKPSRQASILDRDHGRCVLCGRSDVALTIGHLLSVADGLALGATEELLNDDLNLAAMCEACNLGLGDRSVRPATYARILVHVLAAARGRGS